MFKCQYSKELSKPREKPVTVVVETRPKTYYNRYKIGHKLVEKVSYGTEIVKEIKVRAKYANKFSE